MSVAIFSPNPYINKWQISLCNNSSDNKSYWIHRVDVKVSSQVTTVTYMHQSQPSLYSLRNNLTVHLELWPSNHLIWCNATYMKINIFQKVSNWVYLWLSWSYISLCYLSASLKLQFLQCNLICCTPHEAKMLYKLVYKCNVSYLKNKINKNTILWYLLCTSHVWSAVCDVWLRIFRNPHFQFISPIKPI